MTQTRALYRSVAWARTLARNVVRFRLRPALARLRLAWHGWGAGVSSAIGRHLSLGRGVRIFVLPGARLELGHHVRLADRVTLVVHEGAILAIGDGTYVGPDTEIHAAASVVIGADSLLAGGVMIIDHDHAFDLQAPVREKERVASPIAIGAGTWLATRVIVTRGATIGAHSVIAAGAVVASAIPAGSLAGGVPARVLREASPPLKP